MYNEELKKKFIREYTRSDTTARRAQQTFNSLEPYEENWGADLCTRSARELEPIIEAVTGYRAYSRWAVIGLLRRYVEWCIVNRVPGACRGMLEVKLAGLENVRTRMVTGPVHLQRALDQVLEPEADGTVDNLYRCFYWMGFAGMDEEDAVKVRSAEVDFQNQRILYKGESYPLYREAIPAFQKAACLSTIVYRHPNYKDVVKDRTPGDLLLRGFKGDVRVLAFRRALSLKNAAAIEEGRTQLHLSYQRVGLSGLFYRTYENERAGLPVDFSEEADRQFTRGKASGLYTTASDRTVRMKFERQYMEDYRRWKLAFMM